jgi:hypothetical protein
MKEKKLLKIRPLPKVLRVQAIRSKQLCNIYNCYILYGTRTKRRWHGANRHKGDLLLVKNEREETTQNTTVTKLEVLRVQAIKATT